MYSTDDLKSLHGFLRSTNEGNLKKMLVGGKMTEAHLRILLKIARAVPEAEFATHWTAATFPKIKFNPAETALKDTCYDVFGEACSKVGLLSSKAA